MITRRLIAVFDSRLRLAGPAQKALRKVFPDHWTFMFGEIALYSFVVLVMTGIFLALFFDASTADTTYHGSFTPMQGQTTSAAFASAVNLSFDVQAGLLMRQTHHWAALIFIGAIVLHLCRIFFSGAYRRPREINWLIGVTMLLLALLNGFTGYSMPDDLLSGTGLRIIYSVVESVPIVGANLAFLLFGGEFPAEQTVPRMFTAHVFLVPALLTALIAGHLFILVRQKHSQFTGRGRTEHNVVGSRLWPSYTVRTLALFATVLAVLFAFGGLAQINPVWLYGPYDPAQATSPAQPDWYVAWAEGALRLGPRMDIHLFGHDIPSPFFPGAALGAVVFVALYAWPFIERWVTGDRDSHQLLDRPRDHPVRMAIGVYALTLLTLFVLAASDDVLADWLQLRISSLVWTFRILVLVAPVVTAALAFVFARALQGVEGGFTDLTRANLKDALMGRRSTPAVQSPSSARLDLSVTPEANWRWRYVEVDSDENELSLVGTEDYDTESAAAEAAKTAYPEIELDRVRWTPPRAAPRSSPAARRTITVAAIGMVILTWLIRTSSRNKA